MLSQELIDRLAAAIEKEGGWAIPLGLSKLEYFAAHAPRKPNGYGTGGVITELQAEVQWRWEYAYAMMEVSKGKAAAEAQKPN